MITPDLNSAGPSEVLGDSRMLAELLDLLAYRCIVVEIQRSWRLAMSATVSRRPRPA
jgi:hypothetical protein